MSFSTLSAYVRVTDTEPLAGTWVDRKATRGAGSVPAKVTLSPGTTAEWEILGKNDPQAPGISLWKSDQGALNGQIAFYPYVELQVTSVSAGGSVHLFFGSW